MAFVLYTHPKCPNSVQLTNLIQKHALSTRGIVEVENIAQLDLGAAPWLDGVPILLEQASGQLFRGSDAFKAAAQLIAAQRAPPPKEAAPPPSTAVAAASSDAAATTSVLSNESTLHQTNLQKETAFQPMEMT